MFLYLFKVLAKGFRFISKFVKKYNMKTKKNSQDIKYMWISTYLMLKATIIYKVIINKSIIRFNMAHAYSSLSYFIIR